MSRVTLFGLNASDFERVRDELGSVMDSEDALVVYHGQIATLRAVLVRLLQVPVVTIGLNLLGLFVQLPLTVLRNRGLVWIHRSEYEALAGDRPVHFVGDHPVARIADSGWPWIVGNWAVLLGAAYVGPRSVLLMVVLSLVVTGLVSLHRRHGYRRLPVAILAVGFGAGVWLAATVRLNLLFVALFGALAVIATSVSNLRVRDQLLDDVATLATDHEYESVCLVIDKGFVTGLLEQVDDTDLTLEDAFRQRASGAGYHLDADGSPLDQPMLEHAGDNLAERLTARGIDWAVVGVLVVGWAAAELFGMALVDVVLGLNIDFGTTAIVVAGVDFEYGALWFASLVVPATLYYTLTEGVWGQTVGKRVTGIRLVHTDGSAPGIGAAFRRTLVGWVDALPVAYIFGLAHIAGDDYGRRFGDIAARTVVVESAVASGEAPAAEQAATETDRSAESGGEDAQQSDVAQTSEAAAESDDQAESDTDGQQQGVAGDDADGWTESAADETTTDDTAEPVSDSEPAADESTASETEATDDETADGEATEESTVDEEWTAAALDDEQ